MQAAREAIVLLKNDKNLLPLKKTLRSIAVIGPNADPHTSPLGDYAPHSGSATGRLGVGRRQEGRFARHHRYVCGPGCDVTSTESPPRLPKAKEAAAKAEAAIVVLGEAAGRRPAVDRRRRQRFGHARTDRSARGTGQGRAVDRHAHGGRFDQR